MLKYPGGFLLCSIFIGGIGALLAAQAAAAESAVSIDKTQIRAVIEDTTTTITLPVQYHAPAAATYDVSVNIEDLTKKPLGASSMQMELTPDIHELQLIVNAKLDRERLAAYVVHYTISNAAEKVEGWKSLFYAVRQIQTQLLMQTQFYANSQGALRIIVSEPGTRQPLVGAAITLTLAAQPLFQGQTDADGTVDAQFTLPPDLLGSQELVVQVKVNGAIDEIRQTIDIKDVYKILLTTDKPLYQPGQEIHIRSLALKKPDLLPAGAQAMLFEVEDAKGNKVFKRKQTTNAFGVSAVDFQLAQELNEGTYRIRAMFGENTQEKTVTVQRYVLPKFNVVVNTDKQFYQPGQPLTGDVQVDYFFGKPVAGGTVVVALSKFDAQFEKFAELKGTTDEKGHYQFETTLPEYFVGQPLEQGNAFVMAEVTVIDTAEHEEKKTVNRAIAADPLTLVVIPESGTFAPGVENIFYVAASYPDGTPAAVSLEVTTSAAAVPISIQADASGIGEFRLTAAEQSVTFAVTARDATGNTVAKQFQFDADGRLEQILARTDKALYRVGETLRAQILSNKTTGTVYVDLIKDGQTFLTKAVDLKDGKAELEVELAVAGALQLHAYQILASSDMLRDTKLLYVEAADELQIDVLASKQTYLPGEQAQLDFHVSNAKGHPVLAALGVNIVDESVFALQEMQPGLEKVYFMLEKEIMTPRYEVHTYSMEQIVIDAPSRKADAQQQAAEHQARREKAAQALLASAENLADYPVNVNTFAAKAMNVKGLIQEDVIRNFQKIYQALNTYSRKQKHILTAKEGLAAVIQAGLLTSADLLDPWGNPYRIQPGGEDFTYLTFTCFGPDEQENTADDIQFDSYLDLESRDVSLFDWLFGARRKEKGGVMFKQQRGDVMFDAVPMTGAVPMPMAAGAMLEEVEMANVMDMDAAQETSGDSEADAGPRIRQYFPETLYTNPALLTDELGNASIQVTMADSITTWRLTSLASSLTGTLGSGTAAVKVFQDFFVDIDLPVTLTQHDQVSIPIAIYNYLPGTQDVRLQLTPEDWFELVNDPAEKTVTLNSGQVDVVYFTLQVKRIGWHKLTVHAFGSQMSDAIARTIEVVPDGEMQEASWSGRLSGDVTQTVTIPTEALDDASKIIVKVYPGILSQIVEGLDAILQMPSGCFEQTSSATYPNVLVLAYMKEARQVTPEIQMKAESYINTGYQRLLSFEVPGGGFEWFGQAPAHKILTAYGLMEFFDMAQVHDVDPNVISRTQQWLVAQQNADGAWQPTEQYLDEVAAKFTNDVMRNTAYIAWALAATGYTGEPLTKAVAYIRDHIDDIKDTYTLALAANALVIVDKQDAATLKLLETLLNKKQEDGAKIWWNADSATATNAFGVSANIETSALTALAFMQAEKYHDVVGKILTYLIESKDAYGTWHSTQATILAMKAFLMSMKNATSGTDAEVTLLLNGEKVEDFALTPENSDVMRLFDLKDKTVKGENAVVIKFNGTGSALYQIVGRFYRPWQTKPATEMPLTITVNYDKTDMVKDDILTANVTVTNNRAEKANMIIVDLGMPPGFELVPGDLEELVGSGTIAKFNVTGRQIIVYLETLAAQKPLQLSYRLKAKFPVKAKTPQSTVYEYYNPDINDAAQPQELTVSDAAPAH